MRQILVTVSWQSEHLVEVEDEAGLGEAVQVLASQSNVRLVGFTAQPLDEIVDAAVERLLDGDGGTADPL
jgi:hypothetical protein